MHQSSLEKMYYFREKYLSAKLSERLTILDLGSQDVNGTYKDIFDSPSWKYVGVDLMPGSNVDVVLSNPYHYHEVKSESVDVLISGQAFEHIEFFWITMLEVARVLKPGALCCIIVPSGGPEHKFPVDCWRFYSDGLIAMARYAKLEVLEVSTHWEANGYKDGSDEWRDSLLVCCKPRLSILSTFKNNLKTRIQLWAFTLSL